MEKEEKVSSIDEQLSQFAKLVQRLENTICEIEKGYVAEYVEFMKRPKRVLYFNLVAGISRGFGIAIGATAIAALFIYVLGKLAALNIPWIGKFIADITWIVQNHLRLR
ncbi:MAG: hypothetical protein GX766_00120 [Firmicutes bacterium]|jgi:hypothetical protein|nr:hypothetical protein [Bacillota bacterium]HOB21332.1 DUF5665 domain-containing protein [Bacillota bacterium]HQD39572.1 DUF5665 domain-containing protein [Bacillota bacterium]